MTIQAPDVFGADASAELLSLIERYLCGDCGERELERLNAWLESDPAARDRFVDYCTFCGFEREIVRGAHGSSSPMPRPATSGAATGARRAMRFGRFALAAALVLAGVAAAILGVAASDDTKDPGGGEAPRQAIASVIDPGEGLFIGDAAAGAGRAYPAGPVELRGGAAELLLTSGAAIELHGRTSMRLINPMSAVMTRGSATFDCPASAVGYTVHLPDGIRIVDLGTRFRVVIGEDGRAGVRVTEGEVMVTDTARSRTVFVTAGSHATWRGAEPPVEPIATADRVAEFRFDAGEGATSVPNAIPGDIADAKIVGGSWGEVDGVRAVRLVSDTDRIQIRDVPAMPACTIAMGVRFDSLRQQELTGLVMCDRVGGPGTLHYQIERNGTLVFHVYGDERYAFAGVVREEDLGRWLRLTVAYDGPGRSIAVYREGELLERRSLVRPTPVKLDAAHVGMWLMEERTPMRRLDGAIAELAIYERALNDAEVAGAAATRGEPLNGISRTERHP